LLEINRNEFFSLRRNHFKNQVSSINNTIEKVFEKEKELEQLVAISRNEYFTFRKSELNQQLESIIKTTNDIDSIFESNKNNSDFLNESKINSFWFKILSFFSKSKKQT